MKNLVLHNWAPKLMALMIATTLWFLIKKNIDSMSTNYKPIPTHVLR